MAWSLACRACPSEYTWRTCPACLSASKVGDERGVDVQFFKPYGPDWQDRAGLRDWSQLTRVKTENSSLVSTTSVPQYKPF